MNDNLEKVITEEINSLKAEQEDKETAISNILEWLNEEEYQPYKDQIIHWVESGHWEELLNSFYTTLPFGTAGKRGEVGIGPNRINHWAAEHTAQGHGQFLLNHESLSPRKHGIVIAYDVREFTPTELYNKNLPNPVAHLKCKDLAESMASTYAADDIPVYMFAGVRSTPQLSFAVKYLKCTAGVMITASHNPPEYNGIKIYDQTGCQIAPPEDERLMTEINENVSNITKLNFNSAITKGKIKILAQDAEEAYQTACTNTHHEYVIDKSQLRMVFSNLHGPGDLSVLPALKALGFDVHLTPATASHSGKFEGISTNKPNPAEPQVFAPSIKYADEIGAALILCSDPDADRIGLMYKNRQADWQMMDGNDIAVFLSEYSLSRLKEQDSLTDKHTIIKSQVTSSLVERISESYGARCVSDLMVGFKYIGQQINHMKMSDNLDKFVMGVEESNGYLLGSYLREKDATSPAIAIAEIATRLKSNQRNLGDYLDSIYSKHGVYHNERFSIVREGADGADDIERFMSHLRHKQPQNIGPFLVTNVTDHQSGKEFSSQTEKKAYNLITIELDQTDNADVEQILVHFRPSGTEPKLKIYLEVRSVIPNPQLVHKDKNHQQLKRATDQAAKSVKYELKQLVKNILSQ